jgi:hypothetical protein
LSGFGFITSEYSLERYAYWAIYCIKTIPLGSFNDGDDLLVSFPSKNGYYENIDLHFIIVQIGSLGKAIGRANFKILPGGTSRIELPLIYYNY